MSDYEVSFSLLQFNSIVKKNQNQIIIKQKYNYTESNAQINVITNQHVLCLGIKFNLRNGGE